MQVKLLHHTPHIHKLIEITARECYQSFDKMSPTSHKMLKAIMSKGHLSVSAIGNIVFGVMIEHEDEIPLVLDNLSVFKQINNFVRWTDIHHKDNAQTRYDFVVSLNVLSLLDIHKNIDNYHIDTCLFEDMLDEIKHVPEINWFIDSSVVLEPMDNPYKLEAKLGEPTILSEDYTVLKSILTDYEVNIHATVTTNLVYDRATSLQMHRHSDMLGTCELSQRYVDLTNTRFRTPTDLEGSELSIFNAYMEYGIKAYGTIKELLYGCGKKRSQEIARNLLPNVLTNVVQTRPLRQWKHLIDLRNTPHAQKEVREDIQQLISKFEEYNIPTN